MFKWLFIIFNFIFPVNCLACKQEGSYFCSNCQSKYLKIKSTQVCPICLQKSAQGMVCKCCQSKTSLNALVIMANYKENWYLQKLLKQLKYYFAFEIAPILGKQLKQFLQDQNINLTEFVIVPVPLHWYRLFSRGFNQSQLIATELGQTQSLLKRIRATKQQAKLKRVDRLQNLHQAFAFKGKNIPQKVLLVDDVSSTLSTLNECAFVLKKAGVKEVWGTVMARND